MIAAGGLSGGISSVIAGGKFWTGFRQGAITSGLNHLAHYAAGGIKQDKERQNLEKGKKQTLKSLGINTNDTAQKITEQFLKKMPIGDYIEGSELEFMDSRAGAGISTVTRVSETEFNVNPTMVGRIAGIKKNATIIITKKQTYTGMYNNIKNYTVAGVEVRYNNISILTVAGQQVNNFIIKGNYGYYYKSKNIISSWDM
jgi:hypothetical protein